MVSRAHTVTFRFQSTWPAKDIFHGYANDFVKKINDMGGNRLKIEVLPAGAVVLAFLSPLVAMAAFHLKGVSPPHVTLNQIFAGMVPVMGIQIVAIVILYNFSGIGLWLPEVLYKWRFDRDHARRPEWHRPLSRCAHQGAHACHR